MSVKSVLSSLYPFPYEWKRPSTRPENESATPPNHQVSAQQDNAARGKAERGRFMHAVLGSREYGYKGFGKKAEGLSKVDKRAETEKNKLLGRYEALGKKGGDKMLRTAFREGGAVGGSSELFRQAALQIRKIRYSLPNPLTTHTDHKARLFPGQKQKPDETFHRELERAIGNIRQAGAGRPERKLLDIDIPEFDLLKEINAELDARLKDHNRS